MACFQVKLGGSWKDFDPEDDRVFKAILQAGHPRVWCEKRGQQYEYDLRTMEQTNLATGRKRTIRPPHAARSRKFEEYLPGVLVVEVPRGGAGTVISVQHPVVGGEQITVVVPVDAKDFQKMMVNVHDPSSRQDENENPNAVPAEITPARVPTMAMKPHHFSGSRMIRT